MYALPLEQYPEANINLRGFFAYGVALLRLWMNKARQRRQLRNIDPRILDDMGITPEQARRESEKCFWE